LLSEAELRDGRHRTSWDNFVEFLDRLTLIAGGLQGLDVVGSHYHRSFPFVGALASVFVSPANFVEFIFATFSLPSFPHVEFRCDRPAQNRHLIRIRIPEPYRPSLPFGRVNVSAIANMTRHLGLSPANVTAKVDERVGEYDVEYPPSATIAAHVRLAVEAQSVRAMLEQIAEYGSSFRQAIRVTADEAPPVPAFLDKVTKASAAWNLTPRETEALSAVVRGLTNKEIAKRLDCAVGTAELHVKHILRKASVGGRGELTARFWSGF
jgi:DNA-binding CsgD family transcriptional regulator